MIALSNPNMLFCSSFLFIYLFWHNLYQVVELGSPHPLCHKPALCGSSSVKDTIHSVFS